MVIPWYYHGKISIILPIKNWEPPSLKEKKKKTVLTWFYQPGITMVIPRYYRVGKTKKYLLKNPKKMKCCPGITDPVIIITMVIPCGFTVVLPW